MPNGIPFFSRPRVQATRCTRGDGNPHEVKVLRLEQRQHAFAEMEPAPNADVSNQSPAKELGDPPCIRFDDIHMRRNELAQIRVKRFFVMRLMHGQHGDVPAEFLGEIGNETASMDTRSWKEASVGKRSEAFHEPRMSSTKERSVCDSNSQFSFVLASSQAWILFSSRAERFS